VASAQFDSPALPSESEKLSLKYLNSLNLVGWEGEPANVSALASHEQNNFLKEFGCESFVQRIFKRGNRYININLYAFANSEGAYGSYSIMREGATTVVIRGDASSEDDDSISFWQGKYFIYCHMTSQDDEESKDAISSLANELSTLIAAHAQLPDIVSKLPKIDRVIGTEKLLMGVNAFKRYTNLPYANSLRIDATMRCASADYHFEPPNSERMKLTVIEYESPQLANDVFNNYKANVSLSHEPIQDFGGQLLYRISDNYLLCQLKDNRIVIISGAKRKYSPSILLRLISF
jgi:hypothetical protein